MAWETATDRPVCCFEIIWEALAAEGAEFSHVVRTRMFVTDIER